MSVGKSRLFAPGATTMQFWASSSTKIAAVPVENERPKERVDVYSMKVERKK